MYSRSLYGGEGEELRPPENYDGNAFKETHEPMNTPPEGEVTDASAPVSKQKKEADSPFNLSSVFSSVPLLGGLFGGKGKGQFPALSLPSLGTEEILLIAAAAYLFFSRQGDKECAVMLLLLLLVN